MASADPRARTPRAAATLFVYGTLLDPAVRRLVTGRRDRCAPAPARIGHWRRIAIAGVSYPILVRRPAGVVRGLMLRGLEPRALARLDAYETDEYVRLPAVVATAAGRRRTMLYATARPVVAAPRRWSLADWRMRHRRAFLDRLRRRGVPG